MRILSCLLFTLSVMMFVSCGGGGGGLSGSPDQPSQPVSVSLNVSSVTLDTGDTFQFRASVNNATDTTVTWTVNDVVGGNSTVGTMSIDGLYTAPAAVPSPNTVTAQATSNADKSKSATSTITLNPKFAVSPTSTTVTTGETQQFTTNLPVDQWQVNDINGGNSTLGTITASGSTTGVYTAPSVVPTPNSVAVKAIKLGDATKTATATVFITTATAGAPIITPMTVTVPAGGTQQFAVTNGISVNWEVDGASGTDPSTWGTMSFSGLYTAPLSPPWTGKVNIKATSKSDNTKSANAVATIVFSNASLNGHYAFRYRGVDNAVGPSGADHIWAVGSFVADGQGGISGGGMDLSLITSSPPNPVTAPFTGQYSISADGRGSGILTVQTQGGAENIPLRWVMISNASGRMIGFDDTGSGWGNIDMQDPSSFSAGLSGTYVFSYDGLSNGLYPITAAGMFSANAGVISSGLGDFNTPAPDLGGVRQGVPFIGSYTTVDPSTGRGTWNFTDQLTGYTSSFAFYVLNSSAFVFSSTDIGWGELGVAVQQDTSSPFSNTSLTGNSIFISNGYVSVNSNTVSVTSAGLLTADGSGNLVSGVVDNNGNGNLSATGTYSISANGHGTMNIQTGSTSNPVSFYMTTAQQGYFISLNGAMVSAGQFMPQASGTYSTATLRNSLAFTLRATYVSPGEDIAGQMTSDGAGNLNGTADLNDAGTLGPGTSFTGTYTVSANGRGQLAINNGQSTANFAIYLLSGRTALPGAHRFQRSGHARTCLSAILIGLPLRLTNRRLIQTPINCGYTLGEIL